MNKKFIFFSIGNLLVLLALILLIPAVIAYGEIPVQSISGILLDSRLFGFIIAILASLVCGFFLRVAGSQELIGNGIREGFAIVTFGWLTLTLFGAIPLMIYLLAHADNVSVGTIIAVCTDAYFEIMSGFTTTGATIFTNIEILPKGILFWRSLTHWLGGMGIITLVIAILPAFGIASYQMFRGEVPGPTAERLKPRLAQTAKILWGTYGLLTLLETVLLMVGGMTLFDSLCHAFGTMATGGFSTKNLSIGAYNSVYIDWVIIIFMFLAGMNFIIHYRIIFTQKFDLVKTNREFHFYLGVILIAVFIGCVVIFFKGILPEQEIAHSYRFQPLTEQALQEKIVEEQAKVKTPMDIVRQVSFQVVSITTTTGYCTADFDVWPNVLRYLLVILMFFGGCAGSTGGGIKMIRMMIVLKTALREIKTMIQPRIISRIKIARNAVAEKQVSNIVAFVVLFMSCFVIFTLIMSYYISDFTTALTTVSATMCNIGPGLSGIGATENYAWIPNPGKWILILCMLLGRLEIYTVLIAFAPVSWKK